MIPSTIPRIDFEAVARTANANATAIAKQYGVKLGRDGRAPCVIHGGEGRNLKVTDGEGWFCHSGCADGGDMVDFVRRLKFEALSEKEGRLAALRELAAIVGGSAVQYTPPPRKAVAKAKPVDELNALRADGLVPSLSPAIYTALLDHCLTLGDIGSGYLVSRGLDADAARAYGFRSIESAAAWDGVREFLSDSYLLAELRNAGLAHFPWRGNAPALVLPYLVNGTALGLRFRNLNADVAHEDRYRDLGGASVPVPFNSDTLEGCGDLWSVEGELNAYTLSTYGIRAVGVPGAGRCSHEWITLISESVRKPDVVVVWYDTDEPGKSGLSKFAKWFPRGRGTLVVTSDKDANDLHLSGELRELAEQSRVAR